MFRAWLAGILPMVLDTETSIQLRSTEMVVTIILKNIVQYVDSNSSENHLAWSLLAVMADAEHVDLRFVCLITKVRD